MIPDRDPHVPPELVLVRAFVNTRDVEDGTDALDTPAALRAWLAAQGLLPPGSRVGAADLATARDLREGLRAALLAHHDGAPDDPAATAALDRVAGRLPLRVRFDAAGEPDLAPAGRGAPAALARIVADVARARERGTWERLKVCPADDCRWAFYDHSRNRSRRWCAMEVCGNRTKTRAYRRRRATGAPEGPAGDAVTLR